MNEPLNIRSGSQVQSRIIDAVGAQATAANAGDQVMRTLLFLAIALVLASPAAKASGRRPLPF
jgi:hypothetical protein